MKKIFEDWKLKNTIIVFEFERYLQENSINGISPLYQLLRSASAWQLCGHEAFSIPPKENWAEVKSTLLLLKELKDKKILKDYEIVSGYRNKTLNYCAGGKPASAHLTGFAVDIVLDKVSDNNNLCTYWKKEGKQKKMGLSRYPSGRIHIDTHRYRTWGGKDGRGVDSFCK